MAQEGNSIINLTQGDFQKLLAQIKARDIKNIDPQVWEAFVTQTANWWAYTTNLQIMEQIVGSMKEIPKLPSEIPKEGDNHPLLHVEFPPEGGVLTYMGGYEHPYRGFPYFEFVEKMDTIKKVARNVQSAFYHAFAGKRWRMFLLIPLIPCVRQIFYAYAYTFQRVVERFKLLPVRHCKAVRELYRAMSKDRVNEPKQIRELREMIRDYECMLLEFDNAYRFRVQHLLSCLNKDSLKKNPIKEINRLLDIWIEHEKVIDVQNSWRLLKMFTNWYLRFDRQLLRLVVDVLSEINVEETELQVEDKFYFEQRLDYKFPMKISLT